MSIQVNTIRLAYILESPTLTPMLLKLAEESGEEEASSGGGGPPPGWVDFLKEKYEGGKKKVTNPNPDTRKKRPNVSISTALKNKSVLNKVYKEYKEWMKEDKEEDPKPKEEVKGKPKGKIENPKVKTEIKIKNEPEAAPVKNPSVHKPDKKAPPFVNYKKEEAVAEFAKNFSDRNSWGASSKEAVVYYTSGSYEDINGRLRKVEGFDDPDIDSTIKIMDKVFNRPGSTTKEDMSVSRGIGKDHPLAKAIANGTIEVGANFTDPGYTSTSINGNPPWGDVTLKITVPKGSKAIYLGPPEESFSEYSEEHEVLLDRGTTLTVTGWDKESGEIFIEAKTR